MGVREARLGHANRLGGYWTSCAFGWLEVLLLAEHLKAEPVYVANLGEHHILT